MTLGGCLLSTQQRHTCRADTQGNDNDRSHCNRDKSAANILQLHCDALHSQLRRSPGHASHPADIVFRSARIGGSMFYDNKHAALAA
ncbi:MAG: hypothetical protein O2944_11425, partial [Proteobacteria bacterium]|nr:hypothetical protein [Pseudomonadota bacterium]